MWTRSGHVDMYLMYNKAQAAKSNVYSKRHVAVEQMDKTMRVEVGQKAVGDDENGEGLISNGDWRSSVSR